MLLYHQRKNPVILIFRRLNRAHRNAVVEQMARHNLQDVGNPMILFLLAQGLEGADQESGMIPTQKKLAELLHVSPATIANSLKSLERGGYVRKECDPKDARCKQVFITEKGRQAVTRCVQVFDAVDAQLLSGFSPEEQEQLLRFHQRMLDNMRQMGGDADPFPPGHCPASHIPFSHGKE